RRAKKVGDQVVFEYAVDTGLLDALLGVEAQALKEVGQLADPPVAPQSNSHPHDRELPAEALAIYNRVLAQANLRDQVPDDGVIPAEGGPQPGEPAGVAPDARSACE